MNYLSLKNRPLTIVIGFNLFTLLVFFTAPVRWKTDNLFLFLIFSLFCQIMIAIGYNRGFKKYLNMDVSNSILSNLTEKKLNFIFLFYLFTLLYKYAYLLKINLFDIEGMINFLMLGIKNPQIGYELAVDASRPMTLSWYVYFPISIITQVFFIIGFIKWKNISRFKKYLFIFFILIELFFWMGRGTNFGVIYMMTTFAFSYIDNLRIVRLNFKQAMGFSLVIVLLFYGSISVFTYNMKNRTDDKELLIERFSSFGLSEFNENHYILSLIPNSLHPAYMSIVSYLSQGYYHTCLAFDLDFKWTYFLANNPISIANAEMFNIYVWEDTYVYRLRNKGVDPKLKWHSAYLWYASDVSFFGVPFLLYFIGYLFGISWALSIGIGDFLSKIMFVIFGNMLLFLFANNSYLAEIFNSFIFILPIWYFTRVKRIIV